MSAVMTNNMANIDKITQAFDCLVVLVHHVGKSVSGPRGSTVFKDAADATIEVKKSDGKRTLYLEKLRNGRADLEVSFELEAVSGTDDVRVLFSSNWGDTVPKTANRNPDESQSSQIQTAIIEVLRQTQATSGQAVLTRQELRQHECILSCLSSQKNAKSANDTFSRELRKLACREMVSITGKLIILHDGATNRNDTSPTVAVLSPKAA